MAFNPNPSAGPGPGTRRLLRRLLLLAAIPVVGFLVFLIAVMAVAVLNGGIDWR